MQSAAAYKVEQEGFSLVVAVVGHGDAIVMVGAAKFGEPCVAQPPCGHLNALAGVGSFGARVEMFHVEGHAAFPAESAHESLVAVALFAAQLEVAMGCRLHPAFLKHQQEQGHGVGSAAKGNEHGVMNNCLMKDCAR